MYNKPANASEECSPMFILYHQHPACWSGLFKYLFIIPNIGEGVENFFGGVDILFGGL